MKKTIAGLALALSLAMTLNPVVAYADGAFDWGPGCDTYNSGTDNFPLSPCPDYAAKHPTDISTYTGSMCKYINTADDACKKEFPLAIYYSAVALACYFSLTPWGMIGTSWFCIGGGVIATGADLWETFKINDLASEVNADKAMKDIEKDWGFQDSGAALGAFVGAIGALGLTSGITAASAAATAQGAVATAQSNSTLAKAGQYLPMAILATALAIEKFYNWNQIKNTTQDNYSSMCGANVVSAGVTCVAAITDPNKPQPAPSDGGYKGGPGFTPNSPDARVGNTLVNLKDKVDKAFKDGTLAHAFATSGGPLNRGLANHSPADVQKMLNALNDHGISPGDLAASIAQNGVADTLKKLTGEVPNADQVNKAIDDMNAKLKNYATPILQSEFASVGGGGGSGSKSKGPNFGDMLGGLLGGARGPAGNSFGGADALSFGGFNGDIWHAGTNKSIFEIVSERTQTVVDRVGR